MTLTLDLGPEAEEKLQRKADRHNLKLNDYALTVLLTDAEDELPAPGESLAEALQGYIGVVDSRGNNITPGNHSSPAKAGSLQNTAQGFSPGASADVLKPPEMVA